MDTQTAFSCKSSTEGHPKRTDSLVKIILAVYTYISNTQSVYRVSMIWPKSVHVHCVCHALHFKDQALINILYAVNTSTTDKKDHQKMWEKRKYVKLWLCQMICFAIWVRM